MDSGSLTPKQKRVLDFLKAFAAANGYAPSQQEIARRFRLKSLGTVQNYLVRLERQGLLSRAWNARRGVKLHRPETREQQDTPHTGDSLSLPLLGKVAAGRPIEAVEHAESIQVPRALLPRTKGLRNNPNYFVLQVVGRSMVEEGILPGDYVVLRKQETANNGETVVALINNEATIKKYMRLGDRLELHPANADFKPLVFEAPVAGEEARDIRVAGVLVAVLRKVAG